MLCPICLNMSEYGYFTLDEYIVFKWKKCLKVFWFIWLVMTKQLAHCGLWMEESGLVWFCWVTTFSPAGPSPTRNLSFDGIAAHPAEVDLILILLSPATETGINLNSLGYIGFWKCRPLTNWVSPLLAKWHEIRAVPYLCTNVLAPLYMWDKV